MFNETNQMKQNFIALNEQENYYTRIPIIP